LAVTTDTDFGVSSPVTAAAGGGAGAAAEPLEHPATEPATIKLTSMQIMTFM
jgi:hypothetical protein